MTPVWLPLFRRCIWCDCGGGGGFRESLPIWFIDRVNLQRGGEREREMGMVLAVMMVLIIGLLRIQGVLVGVRMDA